MDSCGIWKPSCGMVSAERSSHHHLHQRSWGHTRRPSRSGLMMLLTEGEAEEGHYTLTWDSSYSPPPCASFPVFCHSTPAALGYGVHSMHGGIEYTRVESKAKRAVDLFSYGKLSFMLECDFAVLSTPGSPCFYLKNKQTINASVRHVGLGWTGFSPCHPRNS